MNTTIISELAVTELIQTKYNENAYGKPFFQEKLFIAIAGLFIGCFLLILQYGHNQYALASWIIFFMFSISVMVMEMQKTVLQFCAALYHIEATFEDFKRYRYTRFFNVLRNLISCKDFDLTTSHGIKAFAKEFLRKIKKEPIETHWLFTSEERTYWISFAFLTVNLGLHLGSYTIAMLGIGLFCVEPVFKLLQYTHLRIVRYLLTNAIHHALTEISENPKKYIN